MHCGQIRTIRNLYSKMLGEPARFHPENPTFCELALDHRDGFLVRSIGGFKT
jgi:hypothetical protein